MERIHKLVTYRNRAEALRAMIVDFKDAENRRMLHRLADQYDRMAEALENSLREKPLVF